MGLRADWGSYTFVLTAFNFFGRLNIFQVKRVVLLGGEFPNVPKNLGDGPINVTPSKVKITK
jgi:hypothetical protein